MLFVPLSGKSIKVCQGTFQFNHISLFFQNSSCSCPSDLWQCDPSHGCVCPQGKDCGIEEEAGHEVVINYLQTEEETGLGADSRVGMIAGIVVSVVLVFSIMACLIVAYYRCLTHLYLHIFTIT